MIILQIRSNIFMTKQLPKRFRSYGMKRGLKYAEKRVVYTLPRQQQQSSGKCSEHYTESSFALTPKSTKPNIILLWRIDKHKFPQIFQCG